MIAKILLEQRSNIASFTASSDGSGGIRIVDPPLPTDSSANTASVANAVAAPATHLGDHFVFNATAMTAPNHVDEAEHQTLSEATIIHNPEQFVFKTDIAATTPHALSSSADVHGVDNNLPSGPWGQLAQVGAEINQHADPQHPHDDHLAALIHGHDGFHLV